MPDPEANYPQYLVHTALTAGIPWHRTGDMTTEEVAQVVHARQEQVKEQAQLMAWIAYNGAALTGVAINEPGKFPELEDAFPSLFERETYQDWRIMKERMEDYAREKERRKAQ